MSNSQQGISNIQGEGKFSRHAASRIDSPVSLAESFLVRLDIPC